MQRNDRRYAIKNLLAGAAALGLPTALQATPNSKKASHGPLKGNINHSVCRWCFNDLPLDELCKAVKKIGIGAIDLVGPTEWPTLQKHGLHSAMCNGAQLNLTDGFAGKEYHAPLVKNYAEIIPLVAKNGYKNLICFSGSRRGMDDETGLANCIAGLQQILPIAEKHGVILQMELLNSKVDHKDYLCDKSAWGVELCKRLGSANFKLLYDIYHMQIDEGNVIATINENHAYFGHYHTAGVPGRNEIDDTQELYYPAIMKAIVATGFKDYVAQEFIPLASNKLESLRKAIEICDV